MVVAGGCVDVSGHTAVIARCCCHNDTLLERGRIGVQFELPLTVAQQPPGPIDPSDSEW